VATVTDQLITILKLTGANEYAHGLHTAEKAVEKLGKAQKKGFGVEGGQIGPADPNKFRNVAALLRSGVGKAGVGGALAFLGIQGTRAFAEAEQGAFRTSVALRNLGSSLNIQQVQQFSSQLAQATGVASGEITETVGLLKRFGASDKDVEGLTKTIADFSVGTGISMKEAGTAVGHALIGNTRILKNMGIEFKATGDRAKDLAAVQKKLNDLFGGAGEANRNTVAGAFGVLKESFGSLLEAIGSKLANIVVPVVNILSSVIGFFANNVVLFTTAVGALAGFILGGPMGALIGGIAGLGLGLLPNRADQAANIGNGKSKLATEDTLSKIEKNTSKLNEALIQQVLGGPGTVANAAGNWRDLALGLRA